MKSTGLRKSARLAKASLPLSSPSQEMSSSTPEMSSSTPELSSDHGDSVFSDESTAPRENPHTKKKVRKPGEKARERTKYRKNRKDRNAGAPKPKQKFIGSKGRNTSSGKGVHDGLPKSRKAKSKQVIAPPPLATADAPESTVLPQTVANVQQPTANAPQPTNMPQPATNVQQPTATAPQPTNVPQPATNPQQPTVNVPPRSRAYLVLAVLKEKGKEPSILNIHQTGANTDQAYVECIGRNTDGLGLKIRTKFRIHFEFDLNQHRAYRLYIYMHEHAIFLDIMFRRQTVEHLELYLDTSTHEYQRMAKNVFGHLRGFVQAITAQPKSPKLKHANLLPLTPQMQPPPATVQPPPATVQPPPATSRYEFRNTTARRQRAKKVLTPKEEEEFSVYLPNTIQAEWVFTGWLGKHRKEIEALEGGWITDDGKIIGLDCDWEEVDEPRVDDNVDEAVDEDVTVFDSPRQAAGPTKTKSRGVKGGKGKGKRKRGNVGKK